MKTPTLTAAALPKTGQSASAALIGDCVVCIDDEASFNRLRRGDTYTVVANFDGSPTVIVNGASHSMERFRKATLRRGRGLLANMVLEVEGE